MRVRNRTNGKEITITQKQWDGFNPRTQGNFQVLDDAGTADQVVKDEIVKKPAPPSGTKLTATAQKKLDAKEKKEKIAYGDKLEKEGMIVEAIVVFTELSEAHPKDRKFVKRVKSLLEKKSALDAEEQSDRA